MVLFYYIFCKSKIAEVVLDTLEFFPVLDYGMAMALRAIEICGSLHYS
jgi:hypothetical protein